MDDFFSQKRVLVTGACGTVGRELIRQLLEEYPLGELIALDNNEGELFFLSVLGKSFQKNTMRIVMKEDRRYFAIFTKQRLS